MKNGLLLALAGTFTSAGTSLGLMTENMTIRVAGAVINAVGVGLALYAKVPAKKAPLEVPK